MSENNQTTITGRIHSRLRFIGAALDADVVMVKLRQEKPFLRDFYLVPDDALAYAESNMLVVLKYLESYAIPLSRRAGYDHLYRIANRKFYVSDCLNDRICAVYVKNYVEISLGGGKINYL